MLTAKVFLDGKELSEVALEPKVFSTGSKGFIDQPRFRWKENSTSSIHVSQDWQQEPTIAYVTEWIGS